MTSTIRPPRFDELETLREIERDAGRLFAEIGLDDIAAHDPESIETLTQYLDVGRIWVVVDDGADEPLGYVVVDIVDGLAHIEQISVRANQGRRGLGTMLLEYVCAWAADNGFAAVTLTTFRDVAWNAPFYAKHGFRVLDAAGTGPELTERRAQEATYGLDPALRVCMRRDVPRP
jgi:GNAT superfamily N-acetyltransferase